MKHTIEEIVYVYPTKYEIGFLEEEINELLLEFGIKKKDFNEKHGINTCMIVDEDVINYKTDVYTTIKCCLEKREKSFFEWD